MSQRSSLILDLEQRSAISISIGYEMHYDAIVIGGGHNGLVNAAYLARAGRKVLVLERRHVLGGAAVTEEVFPGFKFSVCSYVVSLLRPEIIRELDLPRHGLEILPLDGTFTPMPSGDYLWRVNDHAKTRREIARHSKVDAEAYDEYGKAMVEMGRFVKPILNMTPPDPTSLEPRGLWTCCSSASRFQALPDEDKYNQVQLMTMSAVDFLDQWFETDVLKATMSASGSSARSWGCARLAPRTCCCTTTWARSTARSARGASSRGGTGAISNAIADAAREAGVEIRTETPVSKIIVKDGPRSAWCSRTATTSPRMSSPRASTRSLTFMKMVGDEHLPGEFVEDVSRYKYRGSSGKVNLALDALPDFTCMPGAGPHLRGAISISPSVDYMERAYDEAKYGRYSRRPYIDMVIPSLTDPSVAPPGKHVMSCFVQYAPYHLQEKAPGTTIATRSATRSINTIAEYAPNIKDIILHRQVADAARHRARLRPVGRQHLPGRADARAAVLPASRARLGAYKTPIKNLYMCGSATHPGGGIMGAPGRNAAMRILKLDTRKK